MSRRENNRSLSRQWAVVVAVLIVGGALTVRVMANAMKETQGSIPPWVIPVSVLVPMSLVLVGTRWLVTRRLARAYLQPGPEALIQLMKLKGVGAMVPNAAALSAYFEAWAYALYGRFDQARSALGRIDWPREPAMMRALATSVEAMLCFLDTRDFSRGYGYARIARATIDVSESFPGAKTSLAACDSLIEIGRALMGSEAAETIPKLVSYSQTLPFGARLLTTWGLAVAHERSGDHASAQAALARCKAMAPHCGPLLSIPPHPDR